MEEYIPALLIPMTVIAFVAYVVHQRWFDSHPWPGSTREELDRILKRNHEELVKKERDEQAQNTKLDGPAEKEKMTPVQAHVTKVFHDRSLLTELQTSISTDQQYKGPDDSLIWKP